MPKVVFRLVGAFLVLFILALGAVGFGWYYGNTPRQYIKNFPTDTDPIAKTDAYQDKVSSWAKETDTLDIGNCRPDPLVVKMTNKSPLLVKNSGWREQIFWVTEKNNFRIPARGSKSVYLDLENGPGFYGFGCKNFDKNFVVRGILQVEEKLIQTTSLPSSVIWGQVVSKNGGLVLEPGGYSLQGKDIVLGKIFKRETYGKYVEIPAGQLQPQDQIYLNYYQNGDLIRGVIDRIVPDDTGWNISLADKQIKVKSGTKFYGQDPSGLFWDRGDKIDGLARGDIVEISSVGVTYTAPVLGAMTGTINVVDEVDGEKMIRIQGGQDDVWVGDYTLIYDQNNPQKRLDMPSVKQRAGGYVLYYMYNGRLVAKSLGLYNL